MADDIRAVSWHDDHVEILDQTRLPSSEEYLKCRQYEEVACAIERLSVRGAPAIGVAAAMAYARAAFQSEAQSTGSMMNYLETAYRRLIDTRPTAVNLRWALERMRACAETAIQNGVSAVRDALKKEALLIAREDVEINRRIGRNGREIIPRKATVMTICNTGSLATGGYGTALGVVRAAVEEGKEVFVAACETRPLLQGARLTAWELQKDGIAFELIADSVAGSYMARKKVDLVIAGADRIAANGDAANKIGTYSLAVLAREHDVPFYIAAPLSTVDTGIASGDEIPIEERPADEITRVMQQPVAPAGVAVWNPAFDVVPNDCITGIITEAGILSQPYDRSIHNCFTQT